MDGTFVFYALTIMPLFLAARYVCFALSHACMCCRFHTHYCAFNHMGDIFGRRDGEMEGGRSEGWIGGVGGYLLSC